MAAARKSRVSMDEIIDKRKRDKARTTGEKRPPSPLNRLGIDGPVVKGRRSGASAKPIASLYDVAGRAAEACARVTVRFAKNMNALNLTKKEFRIIIGAMRGVAQEIDGRRSYDDVTSNKCWVSRTANFQFDSRAAADEFVTAVSHNKFFGMATTMRVFVETSVESR